MPNIEVWGFPHNELLNLEKRIRQAVELAGFTEDAVVSFVLAVVQDCKDPTWKAQSPFLRICSTKLEEIRKIAAQLRAIGIDCDLEYLIVDGFVPKGTVVEILSQPSK